MFLYWISLIIFFYTRLHGFPCIIKLRNHYDILIIYFSFKHLVLVLCKSCHNFLQKKVALPVLLVWFILSSLRFFLSYLFNLEKPKENLYAETNFFIDVFKADRMGWRGFFESCRTCYFLLYNYYIHHSSIIALLKTVKK